MNQESKTLRQPHLLQPLLGRKAARTTMICTHILNRGLLAVISQLDWAKQIGWLKEGKGVLEAAMSRGRS